MKIEIKTNAADSTMNKIHDEMTTLSDILRTELQADILNSDVVSQLIGDTNAIGWSVDTFSIYMLSKSLFSSGLTLRFKFQASGEQDEEKMMYGDEITGVGILGMSDGKLVVWDLEAMLVEPPAERDGEEDAINDCEPEDGANEDE